MKELFATVNFNRLEKNSFEEKEKLHPWQWAEKNINYQKAANYDTPYRGKFDADLMPFWKQPLEMAHDRDTREIVVLKSSRAGYSENFLLTDLRYIICREPEPTLYISGTMDLVKGFLERRVIRGMSLGKELEQRFKLARQVAMEINFQQMDFRATWVSSDSATKQDGWARIYCDEVSLYKEFSVDMIRRRAAAYPFHHIIYGGSIDPTRKGNPSEDPVLKLYQESDKRLWMMKEPGTGSPFFFKMSGIKWPQDAFDGDNWDLNRVEAEAYYETPGGKRIEEADRMDIVRDGFWQITSEGIRPGFKITSGMVPFADCTFGVMARKFLSAKHRMNKTGKREERQNNTLRVYFAEHWAEAHEDEEASARDDTLSCCEASYSLKSMYNPNGSENMLNGVFCTVDVQKYHLWWVARSWFYDKETEKSCSSLIDYGNVPNFEQLDDALAQFEPSLVGIDIAYALRQSEVADYCAEYADLNLKDSRVLALRGNSALTKTPIDWIGRDATEGKTNAGGSPFLELIWSTDVFRSWLIEYLNGGKDWFIPEEWPSDKARNVYTRQVSSTKKAGGEWVSMRKDDHLFDCEVMQMVLARWDGLI